MTFDFKTAVNTVYERAVNGVLAMPEEFRGEVLKTLIDDLSLWLAEACPDDETSGNPVMDIRT